MDLILDLFMPLVDGLAVLQALRQDRRTVPVIAVSGGGLVAQGGHFLQVARALGGGPDPAEALGLLRSLDG